MKILLLLSITFSLQLHAYLVKDTVTKAEVVKMTKSPVKRWSCPLGSKFSKIGGDEPFCRIGYKLIQVKGTNLPDGYGCFKCKSDGKLRPQLQAQ
jgi:hypothetical protein